MKHTLVCWLLFVSLQEGIATLTPSLPTFAIAQSVAQNNLVELTCRLLTTMDSCSPRNERPSHAHPFEVELRSTPMLSDKHQHHTATTPTTSTTTTTTSATDSIETPDTTPHSTHIGKNHAHYEGESHSTIHSHVALLPPAPQPPPLRAAPPPPRTPVGVGLRVPGTSPAPPLPSQGCDDKAEKALPSVNTPWAKTSKKSPFISIDVRVLCRNNKPTPTRRLQFLHRPFVCVIYVLIAPSPNIRLLCRCV